jgi:integrase
MSELVQANEVAKPPTEKDHGQKSSFLTYVNAEGMIADSHSLRKTFIANLSLAGASPKMAQSLARHSDINLTINVYTMVNPSDQAAAVESSPLFGVPRMPCVERPRFRIAG